MIEGDAATMINRDDTKHQRARSINVYTFACALILVLFNVQHLLATVLPVGFSETQIASGLTQTIAIAFSPDGRLFICEKPGRIRVVKTVRC